MGAYIAFDLDALNAAPVVARAAGTTEDVVIGGLSRMWAWCFREGVDAISVGQLTGFFCADVRRQLVDFGFLAPINDSELMRVRGAERYLRIKEAQKRGGEASKGNLKQFAVQKTAKKKAVSVNSTGTVPANDRLEPEDSGKTPPGGVELNPEDTSGYLPALTPNTEHRAPFKRSSLDSSRKPEKNKPKPPKEPDSRHAPLQKALEAEYERQRGAPYGFAGGEDAAHVATLLRMGGPDEALRRWRVAISNETFPRVSALRELVKNWNHFAPKRQEAGRPRRIDIEKTDPGAWTQEGLDAQLREIEHRINGTASNAGAVFPPEVAHG